MFDSKTSKRTAIQAPVLPSPALSTEEKGAIPSAEPLPMTAEEVKRRGWSEVDFVFVTGDAYVDHPSFAAGLLARVLEADGFRVAMLSQPEWKSPDAWKTFGRPRLAFLVSAGNMDSMINHYTANRKVRSSDAYSPNGEPNHRPDRATLAYCQRAREAYPGVNIICGGVEASLRRLAHYDYWSDKVKRSILMDAKAGLLVYGMGEAPLRQIARRLDTGEPLETIRDVRGTVYRLGKSEDLPEESPTLCYLPSFEEVAGDGGDETSFESKKLFAEMTRVAYLNLNPYCAKTLVQEHGEEAIVVNPPQIPLSTEEMDRIYALPFTRRPHPSYGDAPIPALSVVKDSITAMRGCFGGCAFCSLTAHQGKLIQSRSSESILAETAQLAAADDFSGTITDIGGPTANMYRLGCKLESARNTCRKPSCLWPEICPNLDTDQSPALELYRKARQVPGVNNVYIASGVRTDLALKSPEYIRELAEFYTGGQLSTAPEHTDPAVLDLMHKPSIEVYENFCASFDAASNACGKKQFLVPYFIAGLPGCNLKTMVETAEYLKAHHIRPQQVQDFIPAPFELAAAMYYTGIDPLTGDRVHVAKGLRERRLQRALLMYYNPAYYHDVKSALKEARREDLIGDGPNCLIPAYPPKIDNLRQSSRVKRLQRKTAAEQAEKERLRNEWAEKTRQEAQKRSKPTDGPRRFGGRDKPADGERRFGGRDKPSGGERRFGGRPSGGRPSGGRPSGGRPSGGRPSGGGPKRPGPRGPNK